MVGENMNQSTKKISPFLDLAEAFNSISNEVF